VKKLVISICAIVALSACGEGATTPSSTTAPENPVTSTSTVEATKTTLQSDCIDEDYEATCYKVGDVGPAGGTIFYAEYGILGSRCSPLCRYLEVAPTEISFEKVWCTDSSLFKDATQKDVGGGEFNTSIYEDDCPSGAIHEAANYVSPDGTSDWYLPSIRELNELCKYVRNQPTGDLGIDCAPNGYLRVGFTDGGYWSSTEVKDFDNVDNDAFIQYFDNGGITSVPKYAKNRVIAIRMFG
jgi:hypothetical protein